MPSTRLQSSVSNRRWEQAIRTQKVHQVLPRLHRAFLRLLDMLGLRIRRTVEQGIKNLLRLLHAAKHRWHQPGPAFRSTRCSKGPLGAQPREQDSSSLQRSWTGTTARLHGFRIVLGANFAGDDVRSLESFGLSTRLFLAHGNMNRRREDQILSNSLRTKAALRWSRP